MKDAIIIEHNPKQMPITKAVIWLHGLGANGYDFVPVVPELGLSDEVGVRFIFPNAPKLPVTINGGYVMPAWYDILEMGDLSRKVDVVQINQSANRIKEIVKAQENDCILPKDIVVAGFSQGGAVAYQVAMSLPKLGGLLALSTYFATASEFDKHSVLASEALPICIQHGTYDDVVSATLGAQAKTTLESLGFKPSFKLYPMAHQVCMAQIRDIGAWLNERFI